MEKPKFKRSEINTNKIYSNDINKKEANIILEFPLDYNLQSEDEIFSNTYNNYNNNNNTSQIELSMANNINKNKFKNLAKQKPSTKNKKIIISNFNNIAKNINHNIIPNSLKQSKSNKDNNYLRKISNQKLNENSKIVINLNNNKKNEGNKTCTNNKFAKIKNTKKKKDTSSIKEKHLKYKSLKYMMQNSSNKIIKEEIDNNNNGTKSQSNLFYNKYVKEENKMINYNYFVLNPNNITENKKIENNLIQNIIKYPINKSTVNLNSNINGIDSKNKIKNNNSKDLYICLRNSFYKENEIEKDDYFTNTQELLYNNTFNQNKSIVDEIHNRKNNKNNINIKHFSRTFAEIKDIKTIEHNNDINNRNKIISKQNQKLEKYNQKRYLNNRIGENKPISNNIKNKKKDLTIQILFDKKNNNNTNNIQKQKNNRLFKIDSSFNKNKISGVKTPKLSNFILYQEKENKNKCTYLNSTNNTNNTINTITTNKTMINKNMILHSSLHSLQNMKNKNLSLNQRQKQNKKNKLIIYKKRKISNNKCQSKIKKNNLNENDNHSLSNNISNYFTENKSIKQDKLNNFINLSKNMKRIELFRVLTSDRKNIELNLNKINNNKKNSNKNIKKEENQTSYIYMKSNLTKWKNNSKNISPFSTNNNDINNKNKLIELNTKIINNQYFHKKYYNFFIKKTLPKICFINKRYKFRAPINKLCVFSKNIILKEGNKVFNQSNIEEGNNTIMELNSSKFNNTNKNMEILEEGEDNENMDFNLEEYEKNNNSNPLINSINIINEDILINENNQNKPKKNIFKIEKGLEKLCRIFFRNLEIKNKQCNNNNIEIKYMKELILKKDKSEPNIKNKIKKISGIFSSTIQNWNFIDKKNYKKEDDNDNNNEREIIDIKGKKKKRKKHSLLLNIHKAFSEEKIREQIQTERRSVNLNSRYLICKNQNDLLKNNQTNNNNDNNIIIEQKNKINNILNNLTEDNYNNILNESFKLIGNKSNEVNSTFNYNNFEILLNNQFTFVEVIVEKSIKENKNNISISLLAKLCYDLYIKFNTDFIYLKRKKTKGENIKSILKSECNQKFDECDIITLLNISKKELKKEKNLYDKIKDKLLGIIEFISELIKVKMISQKMGLEYLDILNKRINSFNDEIKNYKDLNNIKQIINLYYEGEINLLEKISKIILERKKPKHIQNLKNFIVDNILAIIIDNNINKDLILRFKEFLNWIKNQEYFKDINFNNNKEKIKINSDEKNQEIILLKKEILDYIDFLTNNEENNDNNNIKTDDDFSWEIVDDLICNKNLSLDKIVNYYILICKEIINDNSQVFKANKYIKNVIDYYSYNLNDEDINNIHINILQILLEIDIICNYNMHMFKIIGLLLFVLLTNEKKLFYIKDLNNYLNTNINKQIDLAKAIKFTIIAFGKNWKKYFYIFKKANFFKDSDIFNEYIANPMKLNGFKI